MVDKLILNNQLLANKNKVKKAKIVAINKLVQKIRKLKSLAEKNQENTKIKEKISRNNEILTCAKKFKNMEILKKAILNEKNPLAIITNGRSLPEEIAEAILFTTKPIIEIVKDIKNLLSLHDEINPGWKDKILELSKKEQKQLRTEQKKEIRQQRKARHQLTLKRTEWLEENLPENLLKSVSPDDTKKTENFTSESIIPKTEQKILSNNIKVKPKKDSKKPRKTERTLNNVEGVNDNGEHKSEVLKSVDPFFITQNGDNYLSTVVIDRVQQDGPNDGMIRKDRRAYQNKDSRKQIRKNSFNNSKNIGSSQMQTLENKWKNGSKFEKKFSNLKEIDGTEKELHPSWACKQKERGIKNFSGKKIVFNEGDEGKLIEINTNKIHPSWEAKQKQKGIKVFVGKKTTFESNDSNKLSEKIDSNIVEEKLHPSWEAKQKQKGIKVFAGKKTNFECNDSNYLGKKDESKSVTKSEEKLHPSWEAKQKLKPIISEFKGKKIKFND